jgi:hypothetical protein
MQHTLFSQQIEKPKKVTATTVNDHQNSPFDAGNIRVDVSTANSGISGGSEYLVLMQNAALNGEEQLVEFSDFCADMQDSVMQIMADIDLDEMQPKHNEITNEYGYFLEAMVDHNKWIFEMVAKPYSYRSCNSEYTEPKGSCFHQRIQKFESGAFSIFVF